MNFLRLAETAGWRTVFLGPATPIEDVLAAAHCEQTDLVSVSYRLTPATGVHLLGRFAEAADELRGNGVRFAFQVPATATGKRVEPRSHQDSQSQSHQVCPSRHW